jgi:hypothetical protein
MEGERRREGEENESDAEEAGMGFKNGPELLS